MCVGSTFAWAPSRSRWACFPPGVDSAAFRRSISATRGGSHSFTVTNRQSPKNQTSGRQKHEPKHELHRKRKAPQVKHKNTFFRVEPLHFCLGNVFQDNSSYIRVCRRAGALPSPVLFLVRSAVGLVHTFNACNDSQTCFVGAISPAQFIKQKRSRNRGDSRASVGTFRVRTFFEVSL